MDQSGRHVVFLEESPPWKYNTGYNTSDRLTENFSRGFINAIQESNNVLIVMNYSKHNQIIRTMSQQLQVTAWSLDLSAAFDTVLLTVLLCYIIMLQRLKNPSLDSMKLPYLGFTINIHLNSSGLLSMASNLVHLNFFIWCSSRFCSCSSSLLSLFSINTMHSVQLSLDHLPTRNYFGTQLFNCSLSFS